VGCVWELLSACDGVVCRCVLELHAIAARKEDGGGEFAVAMTYSKLGRHADALAMQERVLEFDRRVLPANHPDIGEGWLGRDAWHAV
jgi:hypothetical protein